jgi:hypothetical protein
MLGAYARQVLGWDYVEIGEEVASLPVLENWTGHGTVRQEVCADANAANSSRVKRAWQEKGAGVAGSRERPWGRTGRDGERRDGVSRWGFGTAQPPLYAFP